jgi:hypothetical protein
VSLLGALAPAVVAIASLCRASSLRRGTARRHPELVGSTLQVLFALVQIAFAPVVHAITLVGGGVSGVGLSVAFIGDLVAPISDKFTLVGGPIAFTSYRFVIHAKPP